MNVSQAGAIRHASTAEITPPPDLTEWEQTFGAPVMVVTDGPVTAGVVDLACHPHDPRGPRVDATDGWAVVAHATTLGAVRHDACCGRCLPEFVRQCSRDGEVTVRWLGVIAAPDESPAVESAAGWAA